MSEVMKQTAIIVHGGLIVPASEIQQIYRGTDDDGNYAVFISTRAYSDKIVWTSEGKEETDQLNTDAKVESIASHLFEVIDPNTIR